MMKRDYSVKSRMLIRLLTSVMMAVLSTAAVMLSGCGGGSGGTTPTVAKATSGMLKLGTSGASAVIAGIDIRINLPSGVSVAADPATGEVASGVLTISGVAAAGSSSLVTGKYTPATGNSPAQVHVAVINAGGFQPGEFASIRFGVAAGASLPSKDAFSVANFSATAPDGTPLSGITAAPLSVVGVGNATGNKQAQLIVTGTPPAAVPVFLNMSVATPTRFSSQTITGNLTNVGDTLTFTTAAPVGTLPATVSDLLITGGTWSALVSGLVEGANIITATEKDGGGAVVATVSATIILDTIPPFINIDTVIDLGDQGRGLAGTAEFDSTIVVKCDHNLADTIFFNDFAQHITRWSGTIIGNIPQGTTSICTVTATDAAGNQADKVVKFSSVGTTAPSLSFSISDTVSTSAPTTISGTVGAGATPSISVNGIPFSGTISVNGSTWSAQLTGLTAGPNIVSVTATDASGHVTTQTVTVTGVTCNGSFSGASQPTVADALKALRIAVGLETPTKQELLSGDLLTDGKIDVGDAILILRKSVGL